MSYLDMADGLERHLDYSGNAFRDQEKKIIEYAFHEYGKHDLCRGCALGCAVPAAPTLKLTCPMTPDYNAAMRARGGLNV